jgi:integrase/recombinase XerD
MCVLLGRFVEWQRVRNFSEQTVINCLKACNKFILWAAERGVERPADVTKPVLERFQRFWFYYRKRDGSPLSFRSQYSHLSPVRAWFKWLARQNYIASNPAAELDLPRREFRLPRTVLSAREAECVLSVPSVAEPVGLRDRAIMEVFYSTGIRRTELINLATDDIDQERGLVLIRLGKGKKDRLVPIGERALLWVNRYLEDVRPKFICGGVSGRTLFLTAEGDSLRPDWLSQKIAQYVEKAEIGKRGSCHMFRHTMATLMLENGADSRIIQAMLGHTHLSTTSLYTQVGIRQLKEIHTATHPARMGRTERADEESEKS